MLTGVPDREPTSKNLDAPLRPLPHADYDSVPLWAVLDQARTPISIISVPHHRFEFANDACRQWLGGSTSIGRRIEDLISNEQGIELARFIDETVDLGCARVERSMALATSHTPRLVDVTCVPLTDTEGPPSRVLVVYAMDVKENPPVEHRRDEAAAVRLGRDPLTVLSHEMRTPLSALGGYVRILLSGIPSGLDEAQVGCLRGIERSCRHLADLVDEMSTSAKSKVDYHIQAIALAQILDEVDSLTKPQRGAKRLRYDCSGADRDLVVQCDRQKVVQVMLNLISNSVKFTPAGGSIAIATEQPALDLVAIVVADSGVGLTSEQLQSVFEPFTQFDNSETSEDRGMGLGMSISREYARGIGGDVTVTSEPGRGSVFKLWLPTR
jgi:signal transduction histidine kinase